MFHVCAPTQPPTNGFCRLRTGISSVEIGSACHKSFKWIWTNAQRQFEKLPHFLSLWEVLVCAVPCAWGSPLIASGLIASQ